ncbi:START domain-containing protein [Thalassolituus sp. C2-1]|uniref:START domain-containing protein n=1 Tax=Venatorbacter sp. C2-1 TaxID=2597518 RepID=UPI001193E27E|nr:START domain-containing protein [Thalassolituus sp. C2-1]TVV43589.1 START domain protein [Thalassolituus sp. C2-1]
MWLVTRLLVIASLMVSQACMADWELAKEDSKRQIIVYTRAAEQSDMREFRGEMRLQTTLSALVALIEDNKAGPEWIYHCRALEVIEQVSEHERLFYMVTEAPWPVKDRDSVIYSVLTQADDYSVHVDMQVRNDVFPANDDFIRITNMKGFWEFRPEGDGWVTVIYQVHADPAGGIPAWLANSMVVDSPYYTLKNMRKMVAKEPYVSSRLPHIRDIASGE